jgi:outer membrane immunogenic protein
MGRRARARREKGWGSGMKRTGSRGLVRAAVAGIGAAAAAVAMPAGAADMAIKAPVAQAAYNWTGCYFGGTLGWGAANSWQSSDLSGFNAGAVSPWQFSLNSQVLAGGTVGCNLQPFAVPLVVGLEGEGGWLHISGRGTQFAGTSTGYMYDTVSTSSGYALMAGRVGWAFLERILVYGKVGVAFYDTNSTIAGTNSAGTAVLATGSKSQDPLAVGGGVEYAFDQHWSGKAEYLFFEKGSSYLACSGASCWREDPSSEYTFKIGLNYKF